MPRSIPARALRCAPAVAAVLLASAVAPALAQVFDFDNVVMLANREQFAGYNDVWGFVGNDAREYVIQGLTTGTAWWDVQDPVNPVLVKVIPAPASTWRDMFVIGDYAYVGCENSGCGIQIVDISDPTDPVLAATYAATVGNSHNIFGDVARKLLYVVGGYANTVNGGLQILDVSNPTSPVEIGQWDNFYIHDLSAEGTLLHLCLITVGRLRIIDTVDPTNPVGFGSRFQDPTGSVHASWPVGDGVHVMIAEETTGGHVKCLDRSDPNNITVSSAWNPAPAASAHNVHVQGDKAYVSWYARGTRILDVSDPDAITEIGYWDTYPDTDAGGVGPGNWGVYPHLPSGLIVSNDRKYGLFLLRYDPNAGTLDGTVSSSEGGVLADVTASLVDPPITQRTDATGTWRFSVFPGPAKEVRFSAFGFEPETLIVNVGADAVVTTPVVLTKLPAGALRGRVTDAGSGLPVPGAEVTVPGAPLATTTDANGDWIFPDVPADTYAIDILRYGYVPARNVPATVPAGGTTDADVALAPGAFLTDFSDPSPWTVSSTIHAANPANATGEWEFGEPFGTYASGVGFQTDLDHTLDPEDQCAVTGNAMVGAIGADDVDSLTTRLLSPVYDLSGMAAPHVFYYRWYAATGTAVAWEVEASSDGGGTWTVIESTAVHEPYWKPVDVDLGDALASFGAVRLRFTARDPDNVQTVEAALDDVTLYDAAAGPVDAPTLPEKRFRLELAQSFPNPFRSTAEIRFALPSREPVELSVFDIRGARVATLVDGVLEAGPHRAVWDGRTFTGARVASGIYFCELRTKSEIRTRKLVHVN